MAPHGVILHIYHRGPRSHASWAKGRGQCKDCKEDVQGEHFCNFEGGKRALEEFGKQIGLKESHKTYLMNVQKQIVHHKALPIVFMLGTVAILTHRASSF